MKVLVLGVSHLTASVDIRERLSFTERQSVAALGKLLQQAAFLESVILSTCNRTEIYVLADDACDCDPVLRRFWAEEKRQPLAEIEPYLYSYEGDDAVRHLLRVTAGLDSLIVGEGQILAQVKAALAQAQALDAAGQYLEALFQQAIKAGKHVRTTTDLGRGGVSVSSAAVELATRHFGSLDDRIVLIYGAGKMSAHTVRALLQKGAKHVYIVNRTLERAQEVASRLGGEAIDLEQGAMLHAVADVIICCTSAPHHLITPANYPRVPGRERMLIDIAVPRNIDPALDGSPGVKVVDLDGLEAVAKRNRESRSGAIVDAEILVEQHLHELASRLATLQAVPTIHAFQAKLAEWGEDATEEFLHHHASWLSRDPAAALARFAQQLVGRLGHEPIARLKALTPNEQMGHAGALAELFGLEVEDATERYLRKRLPERQRAVKAAVTGALALDRDD